jgi:hypothetical protein
MTATIDFTTDHDYGTVISHWSFRMIGILNDLLDYRDLAQDLWDRPKVLVDTATSAIAAGRHDLAEFLLTSAEADLDRLADLADMVYPLA